MELRPRQPVAPFHRARARGGVAAVDLAEQVGVVVRRHRPDRLRGALGRFRVHAAPPADGLDAPHRAHAAAVPRHVPGCALTPPSILLTVAGSRNANSCRRSTASRATCAPSRGARGRAPTRRRPSSSRSGSRSEVAPPHRALDPEGRPGGAPSPRAGPRPGRTAPFPPATSACSRRAPRPGGRRGRRASAPWPRAAPPSPPTRSPALRRPPPSQAGPWRGAAPSAPASSRRAAAPSLRPGGGAPAPLHRPAAGRADLVIRGQPSSQTTLLVDSRATSREAPIPDARSVRVEKSIHLTFSIKKGVDLRQRPNSDTLLSYRPRFVSTAWP